MTESSIDFSQYGVSVQELADAMRRIGRVKYHGTGEEIDSLSASGLAGAEAGKMCHDDLINSLASMKNMGEFIDILIDLPSSDLRKLMFYVYEKRQAKIDSVTPQINPNKLKINRHE